MNVFLSNFPPILEGAHDGVSRDAGSDLFCPQDTRLAQKLSRDTRFKYLQDTALATKLSRDAEFKYLAGTG